MESNERGLKRGVATDGVTQGEGAGAKLETRQDTASTAQSLKPRDAVRRILTAAGMEVPDKEAFWLGYHMEGFVRHTRKHGELLEFPVAVETYIAFFKQGSPAERQVEQLKQALVLFGRGTERWRWVRPAENELPGNPMAGPQGWVLRHRVKASGVNETLVSPSR